MDWTKQSEEMMKAWTETQKKTWNIWMETVQQGSKQNQAAEMWQKIVDTWEQTINNTLEAQNEWTRMWAENFGAKTDLPKEATEWINQAQEMGKRWSETQQQLWRSWFELVKKADSAKMADAWGEEGQKAFKTWQESVQQVMDSQTEWAGMWTPEQTKSKANKSKAKK